MKHPWLKVLALLIIVAGAGCDSNPSFVGPPMATSHVVRGSIFPSITDSASLQVRATALHAGPTPPSTPPPDCAGGVVWATGTVAVDSNSRFTLVLIAPRFETTTCIRLDVLRSSNVIATQIIPFAVFRLVAPRVDTTQVTLTIPKG